MFSPLFKPDKLIIVFVATLLFPFTCISVMLKIGAVKAATIIPMINSNILKNPNTFLLIFSSHELYQKCRW